MAHFYTNRCHTPNIAEPSRDGLASYPRAISEVLGEVVTHEPGRCLDNPIEQDHRGIEHRYYPMWGFGAFDSVRRFCTAFEEVRQYWRTRSA